MKRNKTWCPTCEHFFKDYGLNNCHLVNWREHPLGGCIDVRLWLSMNSNEDSRIHDNATGCPGWLLANELRRSK